MFISGMGVWKCVCMGTVCIEMCVWLHRNQLSPVKRGRAVSRLSLILQHQPSPEEDPLFPSSLDLLPFSLAKSLRRNSCAGQSPCLTPSHPPTLPLSPGSCLVTEGARAVEGETEVQCCHGNLSED